MINFLENYQISSHGSKQLRKAIANALKTNNIDLNHTAIAVSGGPDSAVLAIETSILAHSLNKKPHMFYIHHGLQDIADTWNNKVHELANIIGLPCHSKRVSVAQNTGTGIESAARDARYQAFAEMSEAHNIKHILLAHHQDDQAETVLLRLLRGSGPTGLSAMQNTIKRGELQFIRPWLDIPRALIMQQLQLFLMATSWVAAHDTTNYDERYTRSAVRELLYPPLNKRWPGWKKILARHAAIAQETNQILVEVAAQDLSSLQPSVDNSSFGLKEWRDLSPARQGHVIRHWLEINGFRAPTSARLNNLMRQLRQLHALGHDRHMRVKHENIFICCHKARVYLEVK